MIRDYLRFEGMVVSEASNGYEAMKRLSEASDRPDVIVLDLTMPVMDGWEMVSHLKREPLLRTIPVLVASSRPYTAKESEVLGARGWFSKPIDLVHLRHSIQSLHPW
jgi:CheY-like chemotaxis protein